MGPFGSQWLYKDLVFGGTCILKFNVYLFDRVVKIDSTWVRGSLYMNR